LESSGRTEGEGGWVTLELSALLDTTSSGAMRPFASLAELKKIVDLHMRDRYMHQCCKEHG